MTSRIYSLALLLLCVLLPFGAIAQQDLNLFFMPRAMQVQEVNPAILNQKTVSVGLPSLYVQGLHSGFAWQDLVKSVPGSDSLQLDPASAIAQMDDMNLIRLNVNADILSLAIKIKGLQVSAFAGSRLDVGIRYPRDLVALAWEGNTDYTGQTLNLAPDFQATAWNEIGAGVATKLGKHIDVGVRLKYLAGMADVSAGKRQASFTTAAETYDLSLEADYEIQTAVFSLGDLDSIRPELSFQPFTGNQGLAADLGINVRLWKDRIQLSASAVDLGYINWSKGTKRYTAQGSIRFEGIDPFTLLTHDSIDTQAFADSLLGGITFTEAPATYRSYLPARLYVGGTLTAMKFLRVGAVFHTELYRGEWYPAFAVHAGADLGKILSGGLTWSVRNHRLDNLGANLLLKLGPVVVYSACDNLTAFLAPQAAQQTNLRLGMNLYF
ncbi:MAG: hypothetical protein EAZ89_06590 [Bacteroidetes bacterium]|nr:MAG: hypothetical protein EAZ89_06590 [Bacteroidota bacterium]